MHYIGGDSIVMKTLHRIHSIPSSWSEILWGDYFRDALTQHLHGYIIKLYGFHFLKIGNLSAEIDTRVCPISHQVNVGKKGKSLHVLANPERLPFESKSVDACLLAHTLSWCHDPHGILREVDRVLIDNGWMIISGFNPFSILGIGKIIPRLQHYVPWNGWMFSQMRLLDWISLLNYEVIDCTRFQVLPWNSHEDKIVSNYLHFLGCLNIIVARKRTFPLTMAPMKILVRRQSLRQPVNAARQFCDGLDKPLYCLW